MADEPLVGKVQDAGNEFVDSLQGLANSAVDLGTGVIGTGLQTGFSVLEAALGELKKLADNIAGD